MYCMSLDDHGILKYSQQHELNDNPRINDDCHTLDIQNDA